MTQGYFRRIKENRFRHTFIQKFWWTIIIVSVGLFLTACASVKVWLDNRGLIGYSETITRNFDEDLAQSVSVSADISMKFQLNQVQNIQLDKWILDNVPSQKKVTFPSNIIKSDGIRDTAIFYVYGAKGLKDADVILWIPGFGVSDFAFRFIKTFFINELEAGYTVVFYNIPFHLNRIEHGKEAGEGLVTGNNERNIQLIHYTRGEIDVIIKYLKQRQVKSISGWGGSIGAVYLWLASEKYEFDHMTLMIPVVDWTTLIYHEEMTPVRKMMNQAGVSDSALRKIYSNISPINIPTKVDPDRIQILYAKLDQFTPEVITKKFADKWGISDVKGYNESHASILINSQMFKDNREFINRLKTDVND